MHAVYQWRNPKVDPLHPRALPRASPSSTPGTSRRELQGDGCSLLGNVQLKNYWTVFGNVGLFRAAQDDRATRGGPSMLALRVAATSPSASKATAASGLGRGVELRYDSQRVRRLRPETRASASATGPASSLEISSGPALRRAATAGAVRRHVRGSGRRRDLRRALRLRDARSAGVQPADARQLRACRRRCRCRSTCSRWCRSATTPGSSSSPGRARSTSSSSAATSAAHLRPVGRPLQRRARRRRRAVPFDNPDFNFKSLRLNAIFRWEWRPRLGAVPGLDRAARGPCPPRTVRAAPRHHQHVQGAGRRRGAVQDRLLVSAVRGFADDGVVGGTLRRY